MSTDEGALQLTHQNIIIGKCPQCRKGEVFDKGKIYGCTNFPDCKFSISKEISKAKISLTHARQLISDGLTHEKLVFQKDDDEGEKKEFTCHLSLVKEDGTYKVKFNFHVALGACPKCKTGNIFELDKCYKCNNPDCGAYAFKKYLGSVIKPTHINKLLNEPFQITFNIETKAGHKRKVLLYLKDVFKK